MNIISDDLDGVFEINKNTKLTGVCKAKVVLASGIRLDIDNKFEGVIIGIGDNIVEINYMFNGLIMCDSLICGPNSEMNGDLYISKLIVSDGIIFNVKVHELNKSNNLIF